MVRSEAGKKIGHFLHVNTQVLKSMMFYNSDRSHSKFEYVVVEHVQQRIKFDGDP